MPRPYGGVLIVETDPEFRRLLEQVAAPICYVEAVADFPTARSRALEGGFALLTANLRLREYNALNFVYLMRASLLPTRALIYSDTLDLSLACETQRVGAFYEQKQRVLYSLPAYIRADLPVLDRRDPSVIDRRGLYRGGRRRSDVPLTTVAR